MGGCLFKVAGEPVADSSADVKTCAECPAQATPHSMYASWSTDLHEYHAHQRKIVRHFAPHLSNDALTKQERRYFLIGVTRIVIVFIIPSVVALVLHTWLVKTPVFILVALVSVFELGMAIYRYLVLWPEGHKMRWTYWREIEMSEDCYKLKIMGYYHRKIAKFTGRFPATMASSLIRQHYWNRGVCMVLLFTIAYFASLVLLVRQTDEDPLWLWILYLLAIGCALVVFRFVKMHYIELPQVLTLRDHPEFAIVLMPDAESIPFARSVVTYAAVDDEQPSMPAPISPEKSTL